MKVFNVDDNGITIKYNTNSLQESLIEAGINPAEIQALRIHAIATVRLCDKLLYGYKGKTIPERNR